MIIITCGDSNFLFALEEIEKNIRLFSGAYPVIYDVGLTERDRQKLKSNIVKLDFESSFRSKTNEGYIRTHHKPAAIRNALKKFNQPVLYLDADMLITKRISYQSLPLADVVITPRHPKEMERESHIKNGLLNAGFLLFNNNDKSLGLLNKWAEECGDTRKSDQKALSDLTLGSNEGKAGQYYKVEGAEVACIDPVLWNDVTGRTGYILHFKGIGRNSDKTRKIAKWRSTAHRLRKYGALGQLQLRARRLLYSSGIIEY
ncbi:putative nucleotide-diphospho-sugar transferase [Roseivivax sp. THAF30]|uniref:putative nucleotide-diphospho-sugar transferase n=1 Tax=Roseivivax sp. THAF30 TaxID=2587852 RepID=UPI001267DE8F|nr:putative nucleotide-diphospho-sugar transferase [Roseivivax sp. THAF30]QFT64805.1 hypothetical protein FIU91_17840 [Roseivivax sp. THAF30]